MTENAISGSLYGALMDFRRARSQGELKELLARLTGESSQLLSYDEVRQALNVAGGVDRGVQDIPLDAIVGSVGRYSDFTRDFLPRREVSPERWARVKIAATGLIGLPPIEVYQIGDAYFVQDGNHRVSVARQLGASYIQAYVTEVHSRVPLSPDTQPDDLILKAEYLQFLEGTSLDRLRPGADLRVTIPGQYPILLEHIEVHRYFMGIDLQREVSYEEAVAHWYDFVYLPAVDVIRAQGILRHFPGRTEADLYLWLAEHRQQLEEELGWPVRTEHLASYLVAERQQERQPLFTRLGSRLLDALVPDKLEGGPPTGEWRAQALASRPTDQMFLDLLTPVNGQEDGWCALEQALVFARREGASLYGLHVVPSEEEQSSADALEVKAIFEKRCQESGVSGWLVIAAGDVVEQTCLRAHATDLIVINLSYPPAAQPLAKLGSSIHDMIQRCPRPILATPQTVAQFERLLLAFDGSPKAREALYVAAYLAGKWRIPLVVLSVGDDNQAGSVILDEARLYLEQNGVQATYVGSESPVSQAILRVADEQACDLLILGGYGLSPVLEVFLGSTLDQLLNQSHRPMLICR
jgi:nucleotide-binding universal stress UspA family protein